MWGEGDRFKTTIRFFIYTFIGSLGMLASLLYLYSKTPDPSSFSWEALVAVKLSVKEAIAVGAGLLLAFAVKIPILPFHGWQPKTYVESPSFGTMLLSGIMLKMGLYGLIRWFMPLVPEALSFYNPIIVTLGIAGVIYGAYIAIRQKDLKGIVAYSSLSHVGLIAAGIATLSFTGLQGGLLQMLSHGVNAVGLFFAIDIIERRLHTRSLNQLGGIAKVAPLFSVLFIILVFGATAVPFTNGFPGELLLLKSIFSFHAWQGIIAGLTIILCAVYMLRLFQFSMFGKANNDQLTSFGALQWHEALGMMVLVLFVVFFGLFPQTLLDISGPSIQQLQQVIEQSKEVLS
jgi:NADH-quinone oxidoreductase subunit M